MEMTARKAKLYDLMRRCRKRDVRIVGVGSGRLAAAANMKIAHKRYPLKTS